MARQFPALPARPRANLQLPLIVGVAGAVLSVIAALVATHDFWHAYLTAYMFWWSIAIGCLAVQMIHHVSGGAWGATILRFLEAGSATLVPLAVLFLPLLAGMPYLYAWADPARVAGDPILEHRSVYLNVPFWLIRAIVYFAVWLFLAFRLRRWTVERDAGRAELTGSLRRLSGPGLVLLAATGTFAAFDWLMSVEPHWFSSIFGLIILTGALVSALAFTILAVNVFSRERPLPSALLPGRWNDLGGLLLAFVMLWAYVSFSQFMLMWYGNLTEETPWYLRRLDGAWQIVALLLIMFHFVLPFALLIFREAKRSARALGIVSAVLLVMRLVDMIFQVGPGIDNAVGVFNWPHVVTPLAIGGFWLYFYLRQLATQPIVPVRDPKLMQPTEEVPPMGGEQRGAA